MSVSSRRKSTSAFVERTSRSTSRQQPARRERRRHADAYAPRIVALARLAQRIGDFGQCAAYAAGKTLAIGGHPDAAPRPFDEPNADERFERLDLVADRAVREAQRLGRLRQAAGPRGRLERAQRLHGGNARCQRVSLVRRRFM